MTSLKVHTLDSAPEESRPILEQTEQAIGFFPNLFGVFAESPTALQAYMSLSKLFDGSTLDTAERQIVLLTTSFENRCDYCMAAHSAISMVQGVDGAVIRALRDGEALADPKLEALRSLTREVVRERGWPSEETVARFFEAGYDRGQLLEVLVGVALKTLSNYTNHLAETPLDDAFRPQAWKAPAGSTG